MATAIVTGGSSGIGAEIRRRLMAGGHEVLSLDRAPPTERGFRHFDIDLSDEAATSALAADIAARHAVTILVHNAGAIRPALLPEVHPEDLHALTALHLAAPLILLQASLPAMRAAKFGRVVLLSSRAALGLQTRSAYSATKAGLIGLARTWALELAADGITVNCIAPGPIADTAMFRDVVPEGSAQEARLAAAIPVGRLGRPGDVANAALFFASPDSGFVTGQTLFVCGGSSLGSLAL